MNEILLVPWPVKPIAPGGTVHVYVVTVATAGTVYVAGVPFGDRYGQAFVGPLIKLGVLGLLRTTEMLLAELVPQSFTDRTVMLPVVKLIGNATVTLVVPWPVCTVAPFGAVHT